MIEKIRNLIESAGDEPLKFDTRYEKSLKKKFGKKDLSKEWISENKSSIKSRDKAMTYFYSLFTTDTIFKELKKDHRKIIGTFCNTIPEELIYAAGARPLRLCSGCNASISPAEDVFPRDSCPLIKSSLGFALTDSAFMSKTDVIVIPSTCDGKKKLGEILNCYKPIWMMDMPQSKERDTSKKFWLSETRILKKRLEDLTGNKISKKELRIAIEKLNKRNKAVRRLHNLRKKEIIKGSDVLIVMQAAFFDDIERWIGEVEKLCDHLETRKPIKSKVRLLLTGAPLILPNFKVVNIIEDHAAIVMDETCAGSQYLYDPVEIEEWTMIDMMRAVSERYLMPSVCPCFIKAEDRIDKLLDLIKEYNVNGVVYHTLRLCVLFDVESIKIKEIMNDHKMPFLLLNTDYSKEDIGQLKTRIEAFSEIIEQK